MAIDQISEAIQRQARPVLSLIKAISEISIQGIEEDALADGVTEDFLQSNKSLTSKSLSHLWPPIKSLRYAKKLDKKNRQCRGLTTNDMFMYESSINQHRFSRALNELSLEDCSLFATRDIHNGHFWTKTACQEFWDEYLACEQNIVSTPPTSSFKRDCDTPQKCYLRIPKHVRKLLKRTFLPGSAFEELEKLALRLLENEPSQSFSPYFVGGQVLERSESSAALQLETPFFRVWLHAICKYYGMNSESKTDRIVVVFYKIDADLVSFPTSLYNFLLDQGSIK